MVNCRWRFLFNHRRTNTHYLARLNSDRTIDTTFNPNADNFAYPVVLQSDGKILVGGFFTTISGQIRNRIARLNTNGTLDSTFNPNANDSTISFAQQSDDKILVGGNFTDIEGQARNYIVR